jgi:hypothetical protein
VPRALAQSLASKHQERCLDDRRGANDSSHVSNVWTKVSERGGIPLPMLQIRLLTLVLVRFCRWSCMAKVLEDRTDNDIKNKWYSMYRSGKVQKKQRAIQSSVQAVATSQNPSHSEFQVLEFPPAFSLAPIVANPFSNDLATLPSNEPTNTAGQAIAFSCSWGDLNF